MKPDPNQALDLWITEARRGRDNRWLAEHAGVSQQQVVAWKKKRGLGSAKPVHEQIESLKGLAGHFDPAAHRVASTIDFETPKYVLRDALDYTQFARAVFSLLVVCEFNVEQISAALGMSQADVNRAVLIWRRHLSQRGRTCLGCKVLLDARFGPFCSRSCHDQAVG